MNVRLLVIAAMAVMAGCASDDCVKTVAMRRPDSPSCRMSKLPYKIGIARYTMCAWTLDEALAILHNIDCHYLGLMEGTLKYDATDAEIADYKARCAAYGVEIASAGPEYFSTEEQCRALFAFAKRYGMKYVSVVPFEMRVVDGKKTRCESEAMLDVLEKCVKEYGIRAAIHNHGPDIPHLFPTAEAVMKRIGNRDRRIGVCLDVGHERRAGLDPAAFILVWQRQIREGSEIGWPWLEVVIMDDRLRLVSELASRRGLVDLSPLEERLGVVVTVFSPKFNRSFEGFRIGQQ